MISRNKAIQSGYSDRSGPALFAARNGAAPVSEPKVARAAVLAALDSLVDGGYATWHEQGADRIELHCSSGEAWLLDGTGVTRLR